MFFKITFETVPNPTENSNEPTRHKIGLIKLESSGVIIGIIFEKNIQEKASLTDSTRRKNAYILPVFNKKFKV